ncbi:hypothetical protein SPBR_09006 [Sporothrix brasiliensis 5110]|uniref:Thioredoxin-like fold domain-containing protein n=1 Tax=Sporothrix brasiliensis 5110 TaxID=1398154 RepID=A0A0C2EPQ1_9PEZI|nr:uncharacterized protein SPBR_09006 [Sporothrix brasiliensis 5110]KIH88234.1 hypothetical protein SPBR_09006 [Sporothrix brasiliensis 5110]
MALAPKFAAHRLVFTDLSAAASVAPVHTVEIFLDYVCPFSAKLFNTFYTGVVPVLRSRSSGVGSRVQVIFRQQVQPWHPSSTLTHEAGLAVQRAAVAAGKPQLFWDFSAALFKDQKAYMDVAVVSEGRNDTYKRLAALAAASSGGALDAGTIYKDLAVATEPAADGSVNTGNAVTNDLKLVIRAGRLVGVHVSPTVLFDGLVNNDISSSWTAEQWLEYLEKNAV